MDWILATPRKYWMLLCTHEESHNTLNSYCQREQWKLKTLDGPCIKPYLEPKLTSKLSIMWAKHCNSLYGLSHFEFSLTCKGKSSHQCKCLLHYHTADYLWFHHRAEQCTITYPFMYRLLGGFKKLIVISICRIIRMHILNSSPISISTTSSSAHSWWLCLLSACAFSWVFSWVEFPISWIPWCPLFWTTQDCWDIFSMLSVKEFQVGKLSMDTWACLNSALTLDW